MGQPYYSRSGLARGGESGKECKAKLPHSNKWHAFWHALLLVSFPTAAAAATQGVTHAVVVDAPAPEAEIHIMACHHLLILS